MYNDNTTSIILVQDNEAMHGCISLARGAVNRAY